MKAKLKTNIVFLCPHCGLAEHSENHLFPGQRFGPWFCDECGGSFLGNTAADETIDLELLAERKVETLDVLLLKPQKKSVYFIVPGARYEGRGPSEKTVAEHKRYYYEMHSCPTNWLKPKMVYHDGDADPHGLFTFVSTVDLKALPPDEDLGPNDHDRAMAALIEDHDIDWCGKHREPLVADPVRGLICPACDEGTGGFFRWLLRMLTRRLKKADAVNRHLLTTLEELLKAVEEGVEVKHWPHTAMFDARVAIHRAETMP